MRYYVESDASFTVCQKLLLAIIFAVEEYHDEGGNAIEANGAITASSAVSEFAVDILFVLVLNSESMVDADWPDRLS